MGQALLRTNGPVSVPTTDTHSGRVEDSAVGRRSMGLRSWRWKGHVPEIEQLRAAKDVKALIRALRHEDRDIRRHAVQALGEFADARAVEALIVAVQDPDLEVAAQEALSRMGAPAVEPLVRLIREKGRSTRAAGALSEIRDPKATEPLLALLGDDDQLVRTSAVWALGKVGDRRAVPTLCDSLRDPDLADVSAHALARIGDDRAVPPLVAHLMDTYSHAAAEALDDLAWTPADDSESVVDLIAKGKWLEVPKFGESAVEPLVRCVRQKGRHESVAYALGHVGGARAVETLIWLLQEAERLDRPQISHAAVEALGEIGEPAVEPLINFLTDQNQHAYPRGHAAQALGMIGDPRSIELLAALRASDQAVPGVEEALQQVDAAARPADVVISRRGIREANTLAYLAVDLGDLTHAVPQRTYDIAKAWVERDTPGPLQAPEVEEVTGFASEQGSDTLRSFGYELVWQIGGYDILKKPEPAAV
jgi:HEAT repeat protein